MKMNNFLKAISSFIKFLITDNTYQEACKGNKELDEIMYNYYYTWEETKFF